MKTGKANYGGNQYKKKNYFNQVDGDVVFRILPPLGELADKGIWSRFYSVHFGYKNMEGKLRAFQSPLVKNNKTKTIEVPDAALDRLNDLKSKLEQARAEGNGPLMAKLNTLVGFKGVYSVDNNHHMNVIDLQGNIGVLKIRHKAKLLLDAEIKKLREEGIDPLSLEDGRFFVFTRSNKGLDTSFKVSVYTEKLDVPGVGKVDRQVVHKIGPEILSRLEKEASDLDTIVTKLTSEEVAKIVATSDLLSGKSPACNEYFDTRWKAKRANNDSKSDQNDDSGSDDGQDDVPPVQTKAAPAISSTTASGAQASAAILGSSVPALPPGSIQSQSQSIDELSDEEFFKQIGANT